MGVVHAPEFVDWYNGSFYGKITRAAPNDPFPGYMAPPLDGIWATAPYLPQRLGADHRARAEQPRAPAGVEARRSRRHALRRRRIGLAVGGGAVLAGGRARSEKKFIYDTSYWSQSNTGHTFGDHSRTPNADRSSNT